MTPDISSLSSLEFWVLSALALVVGSFVIFLAFTIWVCFTFLPTIMRVFEETPIFIPPNEPPDITAETVHFRTSDGLTLDGTWVPAASRPLRGTIIFCHEYLSNRWSYRAYCDSLRANGFDIFTFDFRNHGDSESMPSYIPMQWATAHERRDVEAALAYVRSRTGADGWIGLLGISRGGGAAVLTASSNRAVRAVATDGAFPTHYTQLTYMMRWAGIYTGRGVLYRFTPAWYYAFLCEIARQIGGRRHGCRFPKMERAIRRLSPRPLLMIHGGKDSYIVPEIAEHLFECAREPKQLWLVPGAKHNAAVQVAGASYTQRLLDFFAAAI